MLPDAKREYLPIPRAIISEKFERPRFGAARPEGGGKNLKPIVSDVFHGVSCAAPDERSVNCALDRIGTVVSDRRRKRRTLPWAEGDGALWRSRTSKNGVQ